MRELLITRLMHFLYLHGTPVYESMRWKVVFNHIALISGIDIDTKAGRKKAKELDLVNIDFSIFTDDQLIYFFEMVHRRANMCM